MKIENLFHPSLEYMAKIPVHIGRHWKSLALAITALGGGGYLLLAHDRNPQRYPNQTTTESAGSSIPDAGVGEIVAISTANISSVFFIKR